jgi:hypothetical protein
MYSLDGDYDALVALVGSRVATDAMPQNNALSHGALTLTWTCSTRPKFLLCPIRSYFVAAFFREFLRVIPQGLGEVNPHT